MQATPEFTTAIASFLAAAQAKVNDRGAACPLTLEEGPKKVRVVRNETHGGKSVYCFVDKATGDILKAAGWSQAAKGKRGSIFAADCGASAVDGYGANYLR